MLVLVLVLFSCALLGQTEWQQGQTEWQTLEGQLDTETLKAIAENESKYGNMKAGQGGGPGAGQGGGPGAGLGAGIGAAPGGGIGDSIVSDLPLAGTKSSSIDDEEEAKYRNMKAGQGDGIGPGLDLLAGTKSSSSNAKE